VEIIRSMKGRSLGVGGMTLAAMCCLARAVSAEGLELSPSARALVPVLLLQGSPQQRLSGRRGQATKSTTG
jgi:hypothetical protein